MSRLTALIALIACPLVLSLNQGVCKLSYCQCIPAAHPSWTTVNCTIPSNQNIHILEGDIPETTTDLVIDGAEAVMFGVNSLSHLKDARHIAITNTKYIVIRKFAAQNLNVINVFMEIDKCGVLRMEEKSFSNIKGPLSVTIKDCDSVSLDASAFSWLLTLSISNVRQLDLASEVFMLDHTAYNVGKHGPGMTIELKNVTVPEFAAQTFGSSAAAIIMEWTQILAIRSAAFSANTYNVITAVNSSFHLIEEEAFAQKSLINNLQLTGCRIHQLSSKALQSGVGNLSIAHCRFENIETGAINATVASIVIVDSEFNNFMEKGFVLSSWNKLQMERNSFDDLPANAIVAPGGSIHELIFIDNEIETAHPDSLFFIGTAHSNSAPNFVYKDNYYGQPCHCNVSSWLGKVLGANSEELFEDESFCTVDEFFARCFNVPEQNMKLKKFIDGVCSDKATIQCETHDSKKEGEETEIKNPRFPHKNKDQGGLSDRNKKVIGIVIVTTLGCIIIALFVSIIRWMRRKGYCINIKNFLISSNTACGAICDRLCVCGANNGLDNARSISQLSVNEYSERHRLNEPRVQDVTQETILPDTYAEEIIPMVDKMTQTLPEELTKELLENLRQKLEDPENYVEAREMIEHLYELIKVEESCNTKTNNTILNIEENIYELPFQNTVPRLGKNKKKMISIGTRTPSIDKLTPLSPYNRQTALAHEYFEPKDFAVHLYAEIANCDKERKNILGVMPDIVSDQPVPRGPYLRAVRDKMHFGASSSPSNKLLNSISSPSPQNMSTIKSNKSTLSNSSNKMVNRPLPEKPAVLDPGEGTSYKHG